MASFGELLGAEMLAAREARAWTQRTVALKAFGDEDAVRRVRDYETGKVKKRPQPKVYVPLCEALGISERRIADLKSLSGDKTAVNLAEILHLRSETGSLKKALDDLEALTRRQLVTLANMFEVEGSFDFQNNELIDVLSKKAEDYFALQAEVEALDEGAVQLAQLKVDAREAIALGDLQAVERILRSAQELELESMTLTTDLRVRNLLLLGRVKEAVRILLAASAAFAIIDEGKANTKKIDWVWLLLSHGRKYLDESIDLSIEISRETIDEIDYLRHPEIWIDAQYLLASSLVEFGNLNSGEGANHCLSESVLLCEEILDNSKHNLEEKSRALFQQTLANALKRLGTRLAREDGIQLLERAVDTYNKAEFTLSFESFPDEWKANRINCAHALRVLGTRTQGLNSQRFLYMSVNTYRDILNSGTLEPQTEVWAIAKNNLGNALRVLGGRSAGNDVLSLLEEAKNATEEALLIRKKEFSPFDWSMSKNNLGIILRNIGSLTPGERGYNILREAASNFDDIFDVINQGNAAPQWAQAHLNLAYVEIACMHHEFCVNQEICRSAAQKHIVKCLTVYDKEHMPHKYEEASQILDFLKVVA